MNNPVKPNKRKIRQAYESAVAVCQANGWIQDGFSGAWYDSNAFDSYDSAYSCAMEGRSSLEALPKDQTILYHCAEILANRIRGA